MHAEIQTYRAASAWLISSGCVENSDRNSCIISLVASLLRSLAARLPHTERAGLHGCTSTAWTRAFFSKATTTPHTLPHAHAHTHHHHTHHHHHHYRHYHHYHHHTTTTTNPPNAGNSVGSSRGLPARGGPSLGMPVHGGRTSRAGMPPTRLPRSAAQRSWVART